MSTAAGLVAREYLRVSAKGDRSIPEQHDDNVRASGREGFTLGEPYKDQGSASRYAVKARDDFDRLADDLENGRFGADVLQLWESSRGSRKVGEWVTLIELCEERRVQIYVTTHARLYDPANPRDRRSLLEDAVDSEYETAKISSRTRRGISANVANGRPHGTCPFGFKRDYTVVRGGLKPVRQYPHPEEAPLVAELFERILAGDSFRAVERDWSERGLTGRRGKPFTGATLRDMVTGVHYIGLRTHKGETVKANWDGLVSEETFYAVQALVSDPKRMTKAAGGVRNALTAVLRCDTCGGPLAVRHRVRKGRQMPSAYECKVGHIRVSKGDVDRIIIGDTESGDLGVLLAYLARPGHYEALTRTTTDGAVAQQLRDELARLRAGLAEMEEATPETVQEARVLARSIAAKEERVAELDARLRELTQPSALASLFPPLEAGEDVMQRWQATPVTAQRAIAALLLTPQVLGEVRVTKARYGLPMPVTERLRWVRAD